ncbi:3-oxoacyl-[acyl-carrier protein] reductase [Bacillus cereus]|nr:3-oxoacyl-[acyl-carrier protein] reductase [Bacillus cereus]
MTNLQINKQVSNEVIIITGGAGGIGRSTAHEFLKKKGTLVVLLDNNRIALQKIEDEFHQKYPRKLFTISLDVTKEDEVVTAINFIYERFGKIDSFIALAGISPKKDGKKFPFEEIEEPEWDMVMNVNVKSSFLFLKHLAPYMKLKKKGSIVLVSSLAGRTNSPTAGLHYITSKSAILGMTKGLAQELAPYGIRVNCISPGKVKTSMIEGTVAKLNNSYVDSIPLKRFAEPQEITNAIVFLASKESSYIVGANIDVNGGRVMF